MKVSELTKQDFKNYIAGSIFNTIYLSKGKEFDIDQAKDAHQIADEVLKFAQRYNLLRADLK